MVVVGVVGGGWWRWWSVVVVVVVVVAAAAAVEDLDGNCLSMISRNSGQRLAGPNGSMNE